MGVVTLPTGWSEKLSKADDDRPYSLFTKCAAEFLADCVFVFCGSMQAQAVLGYDGILHAALAHGFTIFIMACSFGRVSGAVFNPAISLGIFVAGKMSLLQAILFIMSQLMGGLLGAIIVRTVLTEKVYGDIQGGTTVPGNTDLYQAFLAEVTTSFVLMTVVLMTAVDVDNNTMAPLAIGMAHTVDILAAANITASMNPARSFGPQIVATLFNVSGLKWSFHWIYYVGPATGCSAAAIVYRFTSAMSSQQAPDDSSVNSQPEKRRSSRPAAVKAQSKMKAQTKQEESEESPNATSAAETLVSLAQKRKAPEESPEAVPRKYKVKDSNDASSTSSEGSVAVSPRNTSVELTSGIIHECRTDGLSGAVSTVTVDAEFTADSTSLDVTGTVKRGPEDSVVLPAITPTGAPAPPSSPAEPSWMSSPPPKRTEVAQERFGRAIEALTVQNLVSARRAQNVVSVQRPQNVVPAQREQTVVTTQRDRPLIYKNSVGPSAGRSPALYNGESLTVAAARLMGKPIGSATQKTPKNNGDDVSLPSSSSTPRCAREIPYSPANRSRDAAMIGTMNDRVRQLAQKATRLEKEKDEMRVKIEDLDKVNERVLRERESLKKDVDNLKKEKEASHQDTISLKQEINSLKHQLQDTASLRLEVGDLKHQIEDRDKQIESLNKDAAKKKQVPTPKKDPKLEKEIVKAKEEIASLTKQVEKYKLLLSGENEKAKKTEEKHNKAITSLQRKLKEAEDKIPSAEDRANVVELEELRQWKLQTEEKMTAMDRQMKEKMAAKERQMEEKMAEKDRQLEEKLTAKDRQMEEQNAAKDKQMEEQARRISDLQRDCAFKDSELDHKSKLIESHEEYKQLVKHIMTSKQS